MSADQQEPDLRMDADSLYREETFTDQQVGTIRQMTPVDKDGAVDSSRSVAFVGSTQILTPMGAVPLTFEIEAASLAEAIDQFPEAAKEGLERTVREINEMRRESSSGIVVPDMAGGGGFGGAPGGGKIQLR